MMRPSTRITFALILILISGLVCPVGGGAQQQVVSVVFEPREEAVISARVASVVQKINREFGQKFSADQVLVELDPVIYRLKAQKAVAELEAAQSRYGIFQELFEGARISKLEMKEARRDFLVAQKDHALAEQLLQRCLVRAPFAGRVRAVLAHVGEMVDDGKPLMAIVDDSRLLAKFLLPSHEYGEIALGREVFFRVNETGGKVKGKISHISSVIDPASHTIEVFATVDNSKGALRSGMTAVLDGGER